jgi:hypothetical protein
MYDDQMLYQTTAVDTPMNPMVTVVYLAVVVLMLASMWKIFTKAGKPGWAAIVPIYNIIVLLEVVGRPVWWFVLMLIPFVNIVVWIIVLHDLSKVFGKGVGMTLLNIFLPFIGYPMLAWGAATYTKPATPSGAAPVAS